MPHPFSRQKDRRACCSSSSKENRLLSAMAFKSRAAAASPSSRRRPVYAVMAPPSVIMAYIQVLPSSSFMAKAPLGRMMRRRTGIRSITSFFVRSQASLPDRHPRRRNVWSGLNRVVCPVIMRISLMVLLPFISITFYRICSLYHILNTTLTQEISKTTQEKAVQAGVVCTAFPLGYGR